MEQVGHESAPHLAISSHIGAADVEEVDVLTVVQGGKLLGGVGDRLSHSVVCINPTWKDSEEEDFGLGHHFAQLSDDGFDAKGSRVGIRRAVTDVVGADHDHGNFRLEADDFAVLHTPKHVLGAVAAEAKVRGFSVAVVLVPGRASAALPALRDRVADEDEVVATLLGKVHALFMAIFPPILAQSVGGGDGDLSEGDAGSDGGNHSGILLIREFDLGKNRIMVARIETVFVGLNHFDA